MPSNNRFAAFADGADCASSDSDSGLGTASSSDRSSYVEVPEGCLRLELSNALLSQLSNLFGDGKTDNLSSTVDLPISMCLEIFEAAAKKPHSIDQFEDTENDELLALQLEVELNAIGKREATAADRKTYKRLVKDFGFMEGVDMWTIFADNEYSYENTREVLEAFAAEQPVKKPSAWAPVKDLKIAWNNNMTTMETSCRASKPPQKRSAHVKPKYTTYAQVQCEAEKRIKESRLVHAKHRQLMQQGFDCRGNSKTPGAGQSYMLRAADELRKAQDLLEEANEMLYDYNLYVAGNKIDLHWMKCDWAKWLLEAKLATMDRPAKNKSTPKHLEVITGYGSSPGANGNIKREVTAWLTAKGYKFAQNNPGAFDVTCK